MMKKTICLLSLMALPIVAAQAQTTTKKKTPTAAKKAAEVEQQTQAAVKPVVEKKAPLVQQISGQGYGMAGCGIGSIAFGDQPGMIQVIAVTLNSTFASQTFGITSGTSNCATQSTVGKATMFIDVNRVALSNDMSRGQGESIKNLAEIYGCQDQNLFGNTLQKNFNTIFPSSSIDAEKASLEVLKAVESSPALIKQCRNLG